MLDPTAIDAIVFDIGGVFLVPHPEPIRSILTPMGIDLADDDAFHRAHYRGVRRVAALDIDENDPGFWAHYIADYLDEIGVAEHHVPDAVAAWRALEGRPVKDVWSWVQEHNVHALARFARAGMPMAVVSNNDGTAEEQLRLAGVCQVGPGPLVEVVALVDSGAVGVAKPDPAIFGPALHALGTDPHRTLYVGDMVHADVRGAEAAGMPVVQIDPYDYHLDFAHERVRHLDELADQLLGPERH